MALPNPQIGLQERRNNDDNDNMLVYISGFHGLHPLSVGTVYHYRGHYLYSQALLPIEPQPYPTKGKIIIHGLTMDSAPRYDKFDQRLQHEWNVSAFAKAQYMDTHYGLYG